MTRINQDKKRKMDPYDVVSLKKTLKKIGYDPQFSLKTENTMEIISKLAHTHANNSAVAITDHQTNGLGREKRTWYDNPGCSIMFSALYRIREANIATFADLIALKTCQILRSVTGKKSLQIQYPNDLVENDKKLGGVLVKNIYDDKLHYLGTTVGVGINVHYSEDELSKFTTDYPATSLDICSGSLVKRQPVLVDLLQSFRYLNTETDIIAVNLHARDFFEKQWKQVSSVLGRHVVLLKNNKPLQKGTVKDTMLGRGIQIQTTNEQLWFSLFGSDMKVRVLA